MKAMREVRQVFLLLGLFGLVGGASQITAASSDVPWGRWERHIKQTFATGGHLPAVRVDLAQGYAMLMRAGTLEPFR
jgi:hypothetical protein